MDLTDELSRLVDLHERGGLTDDEFHDAKRRVLDTNAETSTTTPEPGPSGRRPTIVMPSPQSTRPLHGDAGPPPFAKPSTHIMWAVLSMVFCCLPVGIVAVIHAAQVNTRWAAGDWLGAAESSQRAKTWAQTALLAGILAVFLYYLATAWTSANGRSY